MKEDIKLVENLIEEYKMFGDLDGIQDLKPYMESLEHLIKAYKEEKEENESADRVNKALIKQMERNNNIIEDLTNKISELQEKIKDERYFNKHNVEVYKEKTKNSISVSLVEEKIEELNKQYDFYNSDRRETKSIAKGYYIAIQKLEELLEKRK